MPIAELQIDCPILRETLQQLPDIAATVEAQCTYDDTVHLLFWVEGANLDAVTEALDTDSTITQPRRLTDSPPQSLYRVLS